MEPWIEGDLFGMLSHFSERKKKKKQKEILE